MLERRKREWVRFSATGILTRLARIPSAQPRRRIPRSPQPPTRQRPTNRNGGTLRLTAATQRAFCHSAVVTHPPPLGASFYLCNTPRDVHTFLGFVSKKKNPLRHSHPRSFGTRSAGKLYLFLSLSFPLGTDPTMTLARILLL